MHASLSVHDLHLTWPDGYVVFDGLDLAIGPDRHDLVGLNGSGKSTLLRLIAGELHPQSGSITVDGSLAHLPQDLGLTVHRAVGDVISISDILTSLSRIEAGSTSPDDLDVVGDDWNVAERTRVELSRLGLGHLELDRPVGSVSGGELVLLSLAVCLLAAPSVLLLDEPTNNLDGAARERLIDAVSAWSGTLLVVSHDRELLASMDDIGDLRGGPGALVRRRVRPLRDSDRRRAGGSRACGPPRRVRPADPET